MATKLSEIEVTARTLLDEKTPKFWKSPELLGYANACIKDLWRSTVDLKQEHYLSVNPDEVNLPAAADHLTGVPINIHKVYLIEAKLNGSNETNEGLIFRPLDSNHDRFQMARSRDDIEPTNDTIYYSITSPGGPVGAPIIYCAPQVTSNVAIRFSYIPTLEPLAADDFVPIPGEADNAIVAWVVAYARSREREDRIPDPGWIQVYSTEKQNLLQSLGLRQVQEPEVVEAFFASYW